MNASKALGLPWDKDVDTQTVYLPKSETAVTKREMLRNLAKVYDTLGLATPLNFQGKFGLPRNLSQGTVGCPTQ